MKQSPKQAAVDFLEMVCAGKVAEAYRKHVAADFRHHNPWFGGDAASLQAGMAENAAANPGKTLRVHRALQEGNEVAVFSHMRHQPAEPGFALVHIFRFEAGRIAELWDVAQPVPATTINENGMF